MSSYVTSETDELKSLACHNLPTIIWPPRRPRDKASYLEEFAQHMATKFDEPPNRYAMELQEFANLRNRSLGTLSERAIHDSQSLKNLERYYCQLLSILVRFKECGAVFGWKDSFGAGVSEGDIEFELNNIMYNIGSIHNELGSKLPKTSESSAQEAISHFTSALWWVTELRDSRGGMKPKEMGHDPLTFFHHVLKSQAQEIVLNHSLRSNIDPKVVARLSLQIASDCEAASKSAQTALYTDPLRDMMSGSSVFNNWKATVTFKHKYFLALANLLMSVTSRDDTAKEIGTRIARLRAASVSLEACKKLISSTTDEQVVKSAFDSINNIVTRKLDKATRYNESVYHSKVPSEDQLEPIKANLVVKAKAFELSSMPDFKDLFSGLIPVETVQASSIYSQKKDDLARTMKSKVERQDEELVQMMSTLNIDKRSLKLPPLETPDELIEICAELSMSPNIVDEVLTKLEELDDMSEEMQKLLEKAQNTLRKNPKPELESELNRFKGSHQEALKTIESLHRQLYPELQREIQRLSSTKNPSELLPNIDGPKSESEEVIRKLEKILDKIDQMKLQRVSLLNSLKKSLDDDDVMKLVVTVSSEHELKEVFDSQIQKHNKYLSPLEENLKSQNEVLDTLEKLNAQYGQLKLDHRAKQASYKDKVDSMKNFYIKFKATNEGIDKGIEYHKKMLEIVRNFCKNVQADYDLHDLLN